ncbi:MULTISPECIES: VCBS domain-containing protein [unclassified Rhizobium]|uniref:T1SS-143 repeat domain-containing protein n=1 Tax=unclassified Rhizobium TaxID=2613769 RepID=UPI00160C8529|nr:MULTISPECIES: VCBS domain-containing protein [unclassified Rhizobium]MBB3285275.1 T1SS-143 domain-containing protein [Rhizobium sp. BK252]MBB3400014.1 T1SS-143 domain-containing protein [Rhizobium sp. BK289]MBB3412594.1 T1SS-143 domain-containing protein [Rhizobium sp. BK284]MBB3480480.1 T1SS-143 domain-containing protein [Rhizobium sp. BK347]MDK4719152.1 VCBS domain-containing protein [Rhizobium sp. CNPSo 3968]
MDDLRISTVDHEAASHDFASGGRDTGVTADIGADHLLPLSQNADVAAFEVAQAEEQQANGKTGRLAANEPQNAGARQPLQIVPDNGNVVHLPPNTSIDDIHVEGRNLVLIQADGTRIVIINGALHVPTFLIGEVTLPQQAVVAALQQQGINVAEGPDGSVHAGNSTDSGHQFTDSQAGNPRTPLNLLGLLGPGDIIGGGNGRNLSGTQTRVPFIDQQATETASLIERGSSTGAFLTTSSTGRFGFGGNNAAITTVTLVGEAEITGSGTQQLSGLTSGGVPVVVTQNGQTVTGTANGVAVFTLVFNASTGDYTFTQLAALDHPRGANASGDVLQLQFRYTVSDTSGHTVASIANVDITDSVPVAAAATAGSVTEAALAAGNAALSHDTGAATANGSLNISWGADSANTNQGGLGDRSVAFTNTTVLTQGQDGETLSSHGQAVHTVLLADGTLVGYTGETVPTATSASNVVFYATVSDTDNGHYNFTLVQSLDDAKGSDAIKLTFGYTATDSDGDTASNTFTVTIADDKPVAAAGDAGSVTEGALASGNETPHVETDAITTGSLNISWGADNANTDNGSAGDRSVAFTSATVATQGQDGETLSSHGLAVHTVLLADGTLVGYTGEAAPTATSASNVVFYATVSDTDNGHYNFTLVQSLDDAKGSDAIKLTFGYTATDSDGDTASNTFTIIVADDKPVAAAGDAGSVTEGALAGGNENPHVESDTTATGSLNISWGADNANSDKGGGGDRSVAFTNATVTTEGQDGEVLSSHGLAVHTVLLADGTLVGYTGEAAPTAVADAKGAVGSNIVFYATISDTDNGHYNFKLVQSLDDAKGSDAIKLTFGYTATDSDGDIASNTFTVTVADDKPVASDVTVGTGSLYDTTAAEQMPPRPPLEFSEGPTPSEGAADTVSGGSGSLFTAGADGFQQVTFTDPTGLKGIYIDANGVAHKEGLSYNTTTDNLGNTIYTAAGKESGQVLFTLTVGADGSYTYAQSGAFADAKGSDNENFKIAFEVTDGDGDKATGSLTLNVADSLPAANDVTVDSGSLHDTTSTPSGPNLPPVPLLIEQPSEGSTPDGAKTDSNSVSGASGSLFTTGADGFARLTFTNPTGLKAINIDDNGVAHKEGLSYGTSRDDSGNTVYTATGKDSGHVIFTLTVHADGSYTYVQSGAFADAKGSDNENFKIGFEVTDGDGDKATGSLTLNVADSLPVANNATADRLLNDDMFPGGNPDKTDEYNSVSGASGSLFNMGADGFKRVTIAHSDLPQLTTIYTDDNGVAHQEDVIWGKPTISGGATTWVASSANHETVATLTINADGSYTFSTGAPLVHPTAQTAEETLSLTFNFTVTDGDSDKTTGSLTIGIKDDVPIAHTIDNTASTLNDDAQIGGNLDADGANVHSVSGAAGALFSAGADGFASVSIDQSSLPALKTIYVDANGFAQQEDVIWGKPTISGGATTWIASSTNHETVATLTINADGSYTFSTSAPLVHPTSGTTEEGLPLTFTFTVTDGDNDTSTGSLTLHVTDDVPLANTVAVTSVTLNDDALKGGNPDTVGVTDTDTVSGTSGTLFTGGADGVHQVTLGATTDFSAIYIGKDGFAHVESVVWGSPMTAAGGETVWIATGKDSGQTVATLTIGADGSYSFTLSAPVAHQASLTAENTQDLTFNFTVTDGDSDTANGALTVTVKDDAPIAFKVDTALTPLNDDAQAHGNPDGAADAKTINGGAGALFSAGADGVKGVSMDSLPTLKAIYLDGHGIGHQESVSWTSSAANGVTTWTATGASSHATVAVLTINSDGSYSFTADAPLVHSASSTTEDSMTLNFGFTVTDGDGDTAKGSLAIAIIDDVPVASGTTIAARADEGDIYNLLSHGNSPLDGAHDGSSSQPALFGLGFAATVSGSVASTVSFGADGAAIGGGFSFTANAASTLTALHLTSGGGALSYAVVNNVIIGYVDNDHHSGYNPLLDRPVLSLSLSSNGNFTFQQYDQLDNVAGPGNDLRSGNSSISVIDFGSVIQATDGDGDSVTLTGALNITIVDDVPKVDLALTGSITIDESGSGDNDVNANFSVKSLFAGITGGNDPHMSTVYAQHNIVSPSVSIGADDASGATSSLALHIDNADSGLTTTAGQAITLSQLADGTVVGKIADGEIAFAIRIDNSGKVSIAQYMSLANPNTSKSDGDPVDLTGKLSAVLSATDSDGDTVAKSVSIGSSIRFDDDGPSIGVAISTKTLAEHDLLTNTGSLSPSGISTGAVALNLAFGADGPAAHAVAFVAHSNGSYFTASYGNNQTFDATKLSSGGHALSYSLSGDGMTLIAYTGSDAADQSSWVFKVVLTQDSGHANGAYNFTLYKSLDDVNGQTNLSDIKLTFQVAGHDGDGDTTSGTQSFSVDITDDVPTLADHGSVSATVSETAINAPVVTTASYTIDFDTVNPAAAKLTVTEGSVSGGHVGSSFKGGDIVLVSNTGTTFVLTQMDIGVFDHKGVSSKTVTIIGTDAQGHTYSVTTTGKTFSAAGTALEGKQLTSLEIDPHDNSLTVTVDNVHVTDTTTTPTHNPAETTVDLTSLVHASADGPLAWSVNAVAAGTSSGNLTGGTGLTYNGTAITLASTDGHTITGSAGGVTVFTLTVDPASGHATFDLYHAIDGGKTLPLDFSKYVTATDFDGDSVTLGSGSVTIVVQSTTDSLPTISSAGLVSSVSESGLPGGTGTPGVSNVHSGSIAITAGDAPSIVTINGHTFNVGTAIANGDTNATIQGAHGTLHILSVTTTAINYTYTLTGATSGAGKHDDFSVKVSDAPIDGESQTATLTFNINDDKPIASTLSLGSMYENDSSRIFTLSAGTIAFGADGAAQSGAIHVDSVSAGGPLTGTTLSTSIVTIDAGHVTVTPGGVFDALPLGKSSVLSVGYTVTDGDGSKSSGTFNITVHGVNHAPTTADGSVFTSEDADYYFKSTDFAFSDSIDGNKLGYVTINSLPTDGTLYLGSTPVAVGQHIAASALTTLHFTPSAGFAGPTETESFSFTVQDDGGTANGGANTSTAHTMAINVTAIDDGKAAISIADQTTHTGKAIVAGDTLNAAVAADDPDHGQSGLTYAWSWADDSSHTVLGTASSYTVTSADVGHSLILTVSYTDGQGFNDVVTQTTSTVIAPVVFAPTIDTTPLSEAYLATGSDPQPGQLTAAGSIVLGTFDNPHITSVTGADNNAVTVDQTAPDSQTTTIHGSYGDLIIDANGAYTYTLTHPGLNASGDTDQFTYTVTDMNGRTSQSTLTFNIADDAPELTGAGISATVSDDGVVTAGSHSAVVATDLTSLVISGADSPLAWSVNAVAAGTSSGTLTGGTPLTYNGAAVTLTSTDGHTIVGSAAGDTVFTLTVDGAGHASLVLNQVFDGAKVQTLDFSQYVKATDADGDPVTLGTGTFTIVVDHVNHPAVFTGAETGAVTEDLNVVGGFLQTSGQLLVNDADRGESKFQATTINPDGTHLGALTIDADGNWSYKVDDNLSAVQSLGANQTRTDTFTVSSVDGTTHDIVVTINGVNDPAVISGDVAGAVTEAGGVNNGTAGVPLASGVLSATDVDSDPSFTAQNSVATNYGHFTIGADGHWNYVLDNSNNAVQALNSTGSNTTLHDLITVTTADGTLQQIDITINGANDAAVITGDVAKSVTEAGGVDNGTAGIPTTSGVLSSMDVDSDPSFAAQNNVATNYGHFTIGADGHWNYVLDNSNNAVQALNSTGSNTTLHDLITVTTADGTQQQIDITINGTNDAPAFTGDTGNILEGSTAPISGAITVSDVDANQSSFTTASSNSIAGAHGTFTFTNDGSATGAWTYTLNNNDAAVQALTAGAKLTDTLAITSADGTPHNVTVTITGVDSAPVFGTGTTTGSVTEDASYNVGSELIANGGFQDYYFSGGHTYPNGWSFTGAAFEVNAGRLDGTSVMLTANTSSTNNSLSQTISTVVGQTYRLSFYMQDFSTSLAGSGTAIFDVTTGSQTQAISYTYYSSVGPYTLYTVNFVATSSSTVIKFWSPNQPFGYFNIDDVSVKSIAATPGVETTTGSIAFTDTHASYTHTVSYTAPVGSNYYGTFNASVDNINNKVNWTFSVNDSAIQSLGVNDHVNQIYTLTLSDGHGGTVTKDVVVTINGANDAASISGTATGAVTEDGQLTAGGTLAVTDVDRGENHFQTPSSLSGTYGTFSFDANSGVWSYTLNNSAANVHALAGGQVVTDTLTVTSVDGTASQDIVVTINGTDDAPVVDLNGSSASGVDASVNYTKSSSAVILAPSAIVSDADSSNFNGGSLVVTSSGSSDKVSIKNQGTSAGQIGITGTSSGNVTYGNKTIGTYSINGATLTVTFTSTNATQAAVTALLKDIQFSSTSSTAGNRTVTFTVNDGDGGVSSAAHVTVNYTNMPAGISGEAINLALTDPSRHVGAVTLSVAGVPAGWVLSEGTHNADGTWTVATNDPSSLTVTSPNGTTGAVVLQITETWTNADGSTGVATVATNVEAYAKGSPIFAWSGDDTLTASSGNDTLVFANTIGKDVVHNFDVAHDKIDLIGFAGFNSFADVLAHLSTDASGNAVITLGNGETITLTGVSVAALTADDFLFNKEVVTHNAGDMVLADGALMPFSGTLDNTGSIHLASTGSETALEIVQHGLTLTGGGTVILSDDTHNVIFGSGDGVTLTNVDNTISGAGQLGDGHLTLVNEGTIIANGSHALVIDSGAHAVSNTGTLEAIGTGGLDIHSDVVNNGVVWANGGNVNLEGNVSGSGIVLVSGHAGLEIGGSFNEAITLGKNAQATITIDHATAFTGTIAGIDGNDALRFGDISAATASFSYTENAAKTGGVLTVTDGTHTASVGLSGEYSANDFSLGHDGASAEIDFSGIGHLYGTDGNDTLISGGGYAMTGGAGADTFVLDAKALHNLNMADVITDFSPKGEGDKLDVSNLLNALVGEHPGMTEASAVASMTAAVDTATNSTKISVNTGSETHMVATLQNYTPAGHDAVHVLFNNHDEQLATHTQTAGA